MFDVEIEQVLTGGVSTFVQTTVNPRPCLFTQFVLVVVVLFMSDNAQKS